MFDKLNAYEKAIVMFFAINYGNEITKKIYTKYAAKIIPQPFCYEVLESLMQQQFVSKVVSYYSAKSIYQLKKEYVLKALYELKKKENIKLYRSFTTITEHISVLSYSSKKIIKDLLELLSNPKSLKNLIYFQFSVDERVPFITPIIGLPEFDFLISELREDTLITILTPKCNEIIDNDVAFPWERILQLIENRKKDSSYHELINCFAFFYYIATGKICIDLATTIADKYTLQIAAIQQLYKKNYEAAGKLYIKAMQSFNNLNHSKNIFSDTISNYFYALAMLLNNSKSSIKKLELLSKKEISNSNIFLFTFVKIIYNYFILHKDLPNSTSTEVGFSTNENVTYLYFIWTLLKRLEKESEKKYRIDLTRHQPTAAFLRNEMKPMGIVPESDNVEDLFGGSSIINEIRITPLWQAKLEAIINEANQKKEEKALNAQQKKIVFHLDYGYITPIEKKLLNSGKWSVGTKMTMNKFMQLDESYLDDSDRKIQKGVQAWSSLLSFYDNIHLFIGCNHIYAQLNNERKLVNVHLDKPFLIINKKKNGSFEVSSNISEAEPVKNRFYYIKNSTFDYSVFQPTEYELNIYNQLLKTEIFPAEAEPLITKLIKSIGGKTEIHSNMVSELNDIQQEKAPSFVTVRIVPAQYDTFNLSFFIEYSDLLSFIPGEGNVATIIEKDGKRVNILRDLEAEKANLQLIINSLEGFEPLSDYTFDDTLYSKVAFSLSTFQLLKFMDWAKKHEDICQLEWPEDAALKFHQSVQSNKLNLSFKQKNGWFEVEGDVQIAENEIISLQQLLEMMRDSSQKGFIRIGDKEYITLSKQLERILKQLDTATSDNRNHLQIAPAGVGLLNDILSDETLNIKGQENMESLRQRIAESSKLQPRVPKTLKADLRKYQEEGFEWLSRVTSWGAGVCLADDMGLGKTLQTISLLLEQKKEGASLVVAPASVVPNWRNEIRKFAPSLNVLILNSADDRAAMIKKAKQGDIVLATYAMLNINEAELIEQEWNVICLDEAHTIKNPTTKMSKSAMKLRAKRKVILTGTPIQNHLSELWNLFQFINPGLLGSADAFKKKYILPIEGDRNKSRQIQLRKLISPFLLRRTKGEVIEELPEKNEVVRPVELSDTEMARYELQRAQAEAMVEVEKNVSVSTLAEITRLRQLACSTALVDKKWEGVSSKTLAFIDLAESLNDSGNRALVFSQFTSYFAEIKKMMDKTHLPYLYLDGSTPMKKREQLVREFQEGDCPFFLISLKAGGLGLNLTGANYVIHLDPWWNPAIEQQATDRAYRIGQEQDVTVYRLIAQHTIEEKILRLHKTKRDLADSLLEGTDMAHAMTQAELLELLRNK